LKYEKAHGPRSVGVTRACSRESRRPPKPPHGVRLLALVLSLDGVTDRIGPSEGPGPGSNPGRDTAKQDGAQFCPAGVLERMAAFEAAGRGSNPRRGTDVVREGNIAIVLGVWWIARDPAKVEDQVRILMRTLSATCVTSEPDGKAAACKAALSGFDSHRRLFEGLLRWCRPSSGAGSSEIRL
jgi:hypothetical protein